MNFLDRVAQRIYDEKRRELERLLYGNAHNYQPRFMGRKKTRDAAGPVFTYRMGAGFPGDVNRTHPASIEPCLIDASAPPTLYGQPVLVDATTQGVRPIVAGDSAITDIYGVTVRPFPLQANTATPTFNSGTPPVTGVIDILRMGYIMTLLGDGTLTGALKNSTVDVWYATSTGHHVQGSFEASHTGGSSVSLPASVAVFNGTQDANGVVEVQIHQG